MYLFSDIFGDGFFGFLIGDLLDYSSQLFLQCMKMCSTKWWTMGESKERDNSLCLGPPTSKWLHGKYKKVIYHEEPQFCHPFFLWIFHPNSFSLKQNTMYGAYTCYFGWNSCGCSYSGDGWTGVRGESGIKLCFHLCYCFCLSFSDKKYSPNSNMSRSLFSLSQKLHTRWVVISFLIG